MQNAKVPGELGVDNRALLLWDGQRGLCAYTLLPVHYAAVASQAQYLMLC